MAQKILTISFYLLFFLTPLIWTPINFELFEYNKMMFVYLLTIIITVAWIWKMAQTKSLILNKTPLDIPLMLFLGANILSTIFSVDHHTSIWGYYSRSNGGLLSTISYLILYYGLVSNFEKPQVLKFLKSAIFSGGLVAVWAIFEHFGGSFSCAILTGKFNDACWVQDVKARVFATLGQPNWLAAYLAILIFPAIYFALTSTKKITLATYYILLTTFYLAFTFTYSRGATLGLGIAILAFVLIQISSLWQLLVVFLLNLWDGITHYSLPSLHFPKVKFIPPQTWKLQVVILLTFFLINLLFGSALTNFKLLSKFAPPSRPSLTTAITTSGTQLETGGTESGKIRLIVWKGAWQIFLHYPILGSGVETFAYSYYNFRPVEHNLVSEWDFLYNKAHNEYLNYLATTGIVGFASYMAIILTFIVFCIKYYVSSIEDKNTKTHNTYYVLLTTSLLASYISYLVQNVVGFSVVIIALFFYLFPALIFVATDSTKPLKLNFLVKKPVVFQILKPIILLVAASFLLTLFKNYRADIHFATGSNLQEINPGQSYSELTKAVILNPGEPLYHSELGFTAAQVAVPLDTSDATLAATLKDQAVKETNKALATSPKNVSYHRTAIRTYFLLASLDESFTNKTLTEIDDTITLAPTDAKLYYNKAVILEAAGRKEEAIKVLQKTLELKPNYLEAKAALEK